jgi:hypothetical protein
MDIPKDRSIPAMGYLSDRNRPKGRSIPVMGIRKGPSIPVTGILSDRSIRVIPRLGLDRRSTRVTRRLGHGLDLLTSISDFQCRNLLGLLDLPKVPSIPVTAIPKDRSIRVTGFPKLDLRNRAVYRGNSRPKIRKVAVGSGVSFPVMGGCGPAFRNYRPRLLPRTEETAERPHPRPIRKRSDRPTRSSRPFRNLKIKSKI